MANHLPNGPQRNRNPCRVLIGFEFVQQVQVRDRCKKGGVRSDTGARSHLQVILMAVAGGAANDQRGHLQTGGVRGQARNS
jgi:hypothetical protein